MIPKTAKHVAPGLSVSDARFGLEMKKPNRFNLYSSSKQAVCELISLNVKSSFLPVVILSDLCKGWRVFWFETESVVRYWDLSANEARNLIQTLSTTDGQDRLICDIQKRVKFTLEM